MTDKSMAIAVLEEYANRELFTIHWLERNMTTPKFFRDQSEMHRHLSTAMARFTATRAAIELLEGT